MGNKDKTILYFAFGSNILGTRLCRRCPGARFRNLAAAYGYRVAFNKLSEDSSGKANLVSTDAQVSALGVVYEIPVAEVPALDTFEGPGYVRVDHFPVSCLDTGDELRTITYVARQNVSGLKPFDWYLALIVAGMRQRGLDPDYVHALGSTVIIVDPEPSRVTRQNALRDLAGDDYAALLDPAS
jgi:gamma-glutamylcyclotransferase